MLAHLQLLRLVLAHVELDGEAVLVVGHLAGLAIHAEVAEELLGGPLQGREQSERVVHQGHVEGGHQTPLGTGVVVVVDNATVRHLKGFVCKM